MLALAGITVTATAIVWRIESQRNREAELLFVGSEFARAIESYRAIAPNAPQPWPRSLEDLLRDPRSPGVRRHLRKVYRDPVMGGSDWGLIRTQQGGIVGVHSLSQMKPIRIAPAGGLTVREARYTGWLFVARGAPAIVRDTRSGMWMASGASAPVATPAVPSTPAGPPGSTAGTGVDGAPVMSPTNSPSGVSVSGARAPAPGPVVVPGQP